MKSKDESTSKAACLLAIACLLIRRFVCLSFCGTLLPCFLVELPPEDLSFPLLQNARRVAGKFSL